MTHNPATLLLIDIQKGFHDPVWGERNNPEAEANIATLLQHWRKHHLPVVHVQHCSTNPASPLHPDNAGCAFQAVAMPHEGEPVFQKSVNSAFIGTELEPFLRDNGHDTLVIAGLTTDHCVSTSTRMAGNLGFSCYLVADACATFSRKTWDGKTTLSAETIHSVHLASLQGEFCTVLDTETACQRFRLA